ncbi:TPA: hypothetical protein ACF29O_005018, partial [Escherichia coli]
DDKFITTDYLQQCQVYHHRLFATVPLFLLFKFDSLDSSEYRQQIKTFRLKYVFLAAKIIKTARYVIMKLSENYPYKGVYEKCLV